MVARASVVSSPQILRVSPGAGALQAALDLAEPGDTVVLAAGVYRESALMRRSGRAGAPITIEAERPGAAVVTGADVVEGWRETAPGSGEWSVACDLSHFPDGSRYGALAGRCEQVFVDGQPLRQVLHREQLKGGCFCYDSAAKVLFMRPQPFPGELRGGRQAIDAGAITGGGVKAVDRDAPENCWQFLVRPFDPAAHTVEVTRRARIFATEGDHNRPGVEHVVMRGLVFRASGDLPQQAMVRFGGNDLVVEDCLFEFGAARGFDARANRSVFRRCVTRLNGQMGFSGYGDAVLMEDCQTLFNNTKHSSFVCFEQGGSKICRASRWTLRGCRAVGNDGPGIWFDIDNRDVVIERCWCEGNSGPGIMYEISSDAVIRNNVCWKNGYAYGKDHRFDSISNSVGHAEPVYGQGILVQMSRDVRVHNNTCVGNRRCGIELRHHAYQQAGNPGHSPETYRLRNNEVFNNILADNSWDNLMVTPSPRNPSKAAEVSDNRSDHNLFHSSAALLQHEGDLLSYCRWGKTQRAGSQSLEEWRAAEHQDLHSMQWDPLFVSPATGDFRPEAGSAAAARGRPVADMADDFSGRPRPAGAPAMGAFEPVLVAGLLPGAA
jgi:predicted secreted protein